MNVQKQPLEYIPKIILNCWGLIFKKLLIVLTKSLQNIFKGTSFNLQCNLVSCNNTKEKT